MTDALLYWGLGLLALSMVLLLIEVFVPSAGVIGVVAVVLAVVALVCLYRHDWRWGVACTLAVLVLGPSVFFFGLSVFPSTPLGRRIIGPPTVDPEAEREADAELLALINAEGDAVTDLRPAGFIRIDVSTTARPPATTRVQAISEVAFIPAGTRVRITGADGLAVRVRPASQA